MGLFDKFKKNKNELLEETVDVNTSTTISQPFDEARLALEKEEEKKQVVNEVQVPVVEEKKVLEQVAEEIEVLDPGVDLTQVNVCKNCGQKILPGSTVCFLCGKPVK